MVNKSTNIASYATILTLSNALFQDTGAYIKGLFMEGARWCRKDHVITESNAKILYDPMPVVSFRNCL